MPHMYTPSFVQCHPDKLSAHLTDEERDTAMDKFHTLSKAYQVLSDQESKALYDANSQCECAYINKSLIFLYIIILQPHRSLKNGRYLILWTWTQ